MESITCIDRKTGEKVAESVAKEKTLRMLYGTNVGKASLNLLVKRKLLSAIIGRWMYSGFSRRNISKFIEEFNIDMSEYIVPKNGYRSFNEFFYKKVKKDARPIAEGIVSPADGRLLAFDSLSNVKSFFVKGSEFTLNSFLKDEKLSTKYKGGSIAIVRLAPTDYHRYHFPVACTPLRSKEINGYYYSVSPIALRDSLEIFCQNIREYSILKTESYGDALFSEVGATVVGSIVQSYTPEEYVEKGDEKGYFAMGGSTVVIIFEKGKMTFDRDLIENTKQGYETIVKMGEKIGE